MILNRWIRLNDDVCETCCSPTWIKINMPHFDNIIQDIEMDVLITVTCQCGDIGIGEHVPGWAQVDNMNVKQLLSIIGMSKGDDSR